MTEFNETDCILWHRFLVALFLFASTTFGATAVFSKPQEFEAIYRAEYHSILTSGKASRQLTEVEPGRYELITSVKALFFTFKEQSTFLWEPGDNIVPLDYSSSRKLLGSGKEQSIRFDWANNRIMEDLQPWDLALEPGMMDRHSYQIRLKEDILARLQRPDSGYDLAYQIADRGRLKTYQFELIGEEIIEAPLGKFRVIKVSIKRQTDRRSTDMWLALDWDLLLVQLEQMEHGNPDLKLSLISARLGEHTVKGL